MMKQDAGEDHQRAGHRLDDERVCEHDRSAVLIGFQIGDRHQIRREVMMQQRLIRVLINHAPAVRRAQHHVQRGQICL